MKNSIKSKLNIRLITRLAAIFASLAVGSNNIVQFLQHVHALPFESCEPTQLSSLDPQITIAPLKFPKSKN